MNDWDDEDGEPEKGGGRGPDAAGSGLAVGLIAMLPLLGLYELSLGSLDGGRSTAEWLLAYAPERLGMPVALLRRGAIVIAGAVAICVVVKRRRGVVPPVVRVVAEGIVGGLALGPILVGLMHLARDVVPLPALGGAPGTAPEVGRAAFVMGAAAWEEILFRVGAYAVLFFLTRQLAGFFGASRRLAVFLAEVVGLLGSSVLFAGAHLSRFTSWLGPGGEPFDAPCFTWRLLAGVLLGLLFRWRGPGVAAWSHGLFNLALLLGAGPDVFIGPGA